MTGTHSKIMSLPNSPSATDLATIRAISCGGVCGIFSQVQQGSLPEEASIFFWHTGGERRASDKRFFYAPRLARPTECAQALFIVTFLKRFTDKGPFSGGFCV